MPKNYDIVDSYWRWLILEAKKIGRPRTPDYRKKRFRLSAIEDKFQVVLERMESKNDRKLIESLLDELKKA